MIENEEKLLFNLSFSNQYSIKNNEIYHENKKSLFANLVKSRNEKCKNCKHFILCSNIIAGANILAHIECGKVKNEKYKINKKMEREK